MTLSKLFVAALLAPTLALAQAPAANPVYPAEPVQAAPPPAYAPPAPRSQQRDGWYIGFGLGTGNGSVSGQGDSFTFKELQGTSPTNLALNFRVGGTLSPKLLLGLDVNAVRSASDSGGVSRAVQITNYDAMLTFFPMEKGFFVRGGLGLSALTFDANVNGLGSGSTTYRGGNALVGVGYAFWLGQQFNLTVNLDYSGQSYGSSNDSPETSSMWALGLGFDWY